MAHLNLGVAVWLCVVVGAVFIAAMNEQSLLPSLPASQEESSIANLWRHALRQQKNPAGVVLRSEEPAPKTYVSPDYVEVTNWVPQDSAHPLYVPENADLLREILFDYMVDEEVKPDDPRMNQPDGLQVTNLNGKTLTFKRDASGIKVEGVTVTESTTNEDGTVSYQLDRSLFNHRQRVNQAWEELPKTSTNFGGPIPAPAADPQE